MEKGKYFGVPKPEPPKFECPKAVTLPNETRRFSLGDGTFSRTTDSFVNGDECSGE